MWYGIHLNIFEGEGGEKPETYSVTSLYARCFLSAAEGQRPGIFLPLPSPPCTNGLLAKQKKTYACPALTAAGILQNCEHFCEVGKNTVVFFWRVSASYTQDHVATCNSIVMQFGYCFFSCKSNPDTSRLLFFYPFSFSFFTCSFGWQRRPLTG